MNERVNEWRAIGPEEGSLNCSYAYQYLKYDTCPFGERSVGGRRRWFVVKFRRSVINQLLLSMAALDCVCGFMAVSWHLSDFRSVSGTGGYSHALSSAKAVLELLRSRCDKRFNRVYTIIHISRCDTFDSLVHLYPRFVCLFIKQLIPGTSRLWGKITLYSYQTMITVCRRRRAISICT